MLRLFISFKVIHGKAHKNPIGKVHRAIERILDIDANPYCTFTEYFMLTESTFGLETITVRFIIRGGI
jgi:hypothetical protein